MKARKTAAKPKTDGPMAAAIAAVGALVDRTEAAAAKIAQPHVPVTHAIPEPPEVASPVSAYGMEGQDHRTHIERINRFTNPADGTGAGHGHHGPGVASKPREIPKDPGQRRHYLTTRHAKHGDLILPPGTIVSLYDHEVEGHHRLVEE